MGVLGRPRRRRGGRGGHPGLSDHVVVGGYGLNGHHLARVLASSPCQYLVVDLDRRAVEEARRDGHPAVFGDLTRPEIQEICGVPRARAVVLALSDPQAMGDAIKVSRSVAPDVFILARGRWVRELDELRELGATEVVAEDFETSIEVVTRVLRQLHIPGNVDPSRGPAAPRRRVRDAPGAHLPAGDLG